MCVNPLHTRRDLSPRVCSFLSSCVKTLAFCGNFENRQNLEEYHKKVR